MHEVILPSLPKFKVNQGVEFCFDKKKVYFVLDYGVVSVVCFMSAGCVVATYDVMPENGDPQNSVDIDFKYLKVGETEVSIDQSDIDLVNGQKIELTEKQIFELNEYLKEEMIKV